MIRRKSPRRSAAESFLSRNTARSIPKTRSNTSAILTASHSIRSRAERYHLEQTTSNDCPGQDGAQRRLQGVAEPCHSRAQQDDAAAARKAPPLADCIRHYGRPGREKCPDRKEKFHRQLP